MGEEEMKMEEVKMETQMKMKRNEMRDWCLEGKAILSGITLRQQHRNIRH